MNLAQSHSVMSSSWNKRSVTCSPASSVDLIGDLLELALGGSADRAYPVIG
jgi:hypothetical protein